VDVAQHEFTVPNPRNIRGKVDALQKAISQFEQYEPETKHTFHGGMYCREVFRVAGALIVGKVHKKEHFYYVVHGTVLITTDSGAQEVTGPRLICSKPSTKRAVYAVTDALCVTFHRTDSDTVDDAENELVEIDPDAMFGHSNMLKIQPVEVLS
jgi:hypothetical protein